MSPFTLTSATNTEIKFISDNTHTHILLRAEQIGGMIYSYCTDEYKVCGKGKGGVCYCGIEGERLVTLPGRWRGVRAFYTAWKMERDGVCYCGIEGEGLVTWSVELRKQGLLLCLGDRKRQGLLHCLEDAEGQGLSLFCGIEGGGAFYFA